MGPRCVSVYGRPSRVGDHQVHGNPRHRRASLGGDVGCAVELAREANISPAATNWVKALPAIMCILMFCSFNLFTKPSPLVFTIAPTIRAPVSSPDSPMLSRKAGRVRPSKFFGTSAAARKFLL